MPKPKILLIDDDRDHCAVIKDMQESSCECEVVVAYSGKEGVEKAKTEKPDLVLVDTCLPDIDGFEVCRQIKKVKKLDTKVMVYTGKLDAIDAVKARRMGADDYCVKGSDLSLFIETVKKYVL